jgi:Domain of unknown function (DUF4214)
LALAPANFGDLSGDLLVGNFGDGKINAFNPNTGAALGALNGPGGQPIQIDSLWGLAFGNGATAGAANKLYFTAGIGGEAHGLFGSLSANNSSALSGGGTTIVATRGQAFNGVVGTFSALDPTATAGEFSATINWGDGSSSAGTIDVNSSGAFEVKGTHTFAAAGQDNISVAVTGVATTANPTGSSLTINSQAVVNDAALALTGTNVTIGASLAAANVAVGTFNDAGGAQALGNYTATISWGDGTGSTAGTVVANGQGAASQFSITGSHSYARPGHFTISISLSSSGGSTANATASAVVGTHNQLFLAKAYQDLLSRPLDPTGLAFFTSELDGGTSAAAVALGITSGEEFHTDEVAAIYSHLLQRIPDPFGLASGVSLLASGGTVEQLEASIAGSQEYFQLHGSTNDGFVKAIYQDALGRAADSTGETFFDQALAGGVARGQVAAILFGSAEYRQNLVGSYFQKYLHRAADQGGLTLFTNQLAAGARDEAVIASIVGSAEYTGAV